jgi:hypothetical protein
MRRQSGSAPPNPTSSHVPHVVSDRRPLAAPRGYLQISPVLNGKQRRCDQLAKIASRHRLNVLDYGGRTSDVAVAVMPGVLGEL